MTTQLEGQLRLDPTEVESIMFDAVQRVTFSIPTHCFDSPDKLVRNLVAFELVGSGGLRVIEVRAFVDSSRPGGWRFEPATNRVVHRSTCQVEWLDQTAYLIVPWDGPVRRICVNAACGAWLERVIWGP